MRLPESQIHLTRRARDVEPMHIERYHNSDEWVEMRINPVRISIQARKVINRVQTNTRWVFQHWGSEPVTIAYNGVTGYIQSMTSEVFTDLHFTQGYEYDLTQRYEEPRPGARYISPYETPAYQALMVLRTFYEEPHKSLQGRDLTALRGETIDAELDRLLLKMSYRDSNYLGYFTRMEIQEEENSPWMWTYNMEFVAFYHETKQAVTGKELSALVQALFATSPGFNVSADDQLAAAWKRGMGATVGSAAARKVFGFYGYY